MMMRPLVAIAALCIGTAAAAEVTRCTDAAGAVTYTDQRCPPTTRQSAELPATSTLSVVPASVPVAPASRSAGRAVAEAPASPPTARPGLAAPAAPGTGMVGSRAGYDDESLRREPYPEPYPVPYPVPYPPVYDGYPTARRLPPPTRDMRPRLRDCDAGGCNDTQGNRFDRTGRLERYTRPDGRSCQPIGTTVVCR